MHFIDNAAKKLMNSRDIYKCILTLKELRLSHEKYRSDHRKIDLG